MKLQEEEEGKRKKSRGKGGKTRRGFPFKIV